MKASQQLAGGRNRLCEWAWYAIALVLVLAFGALNLQLPFVSDQIATMMGAKTLAQGGTLYVDFWDNKMPGLYWFYLLAGESFGYTEFGIHLLDMIWMTVFSVILALSLRTYFTYPWLSALPPLTVVGLYYVSVETQQLTQLEILVALPMFLSAWFATRFPKSAGRFILAFTASGLCAGIAVVFKLVFALLFVAFWLVVTVHLRASKRLEWFSIAARVWLPVSVGVGAVLGAVVLKFWLDGALFELYWTAFVYPPQALAMSTPAPYYRLGESLIFIGTYFAPWALFIAFAVAHWWRHERDPLTSVLVAWFLVGIVIIYIQRFSWWPYHFLILFTPAGILGIRGADVACDFIMNVKRERAWSAYLVSAMIVFPGIAALAVPAGQKANAYIEVFVKKPGTVQDFHQGISTFYRVYSGAPGSWSMKERVPARSTSSATHSITICPAANRPYRSSAGPGAIFYSRNGSNCLSNSKRHVRLTFTLTNETST